ncbi:MAG: hypothetical protein KAI79_15070 [Bacteroidales bacterium]|nr:hypothetical protein [Bacteroidales bacterium]
MNGLRRKVKYFFTALVFSTVIMSTSSCDILLEILDELAEPVDNTQEEEKKAPSGKTMKKFPAPEE